MLGLFCFRSLYPAAISMSLFTRLFPLWAAFAAVLAYLSPASFVGLLPYVTWLLMLVMLGMGATLSFSDFRRVLVRPGPVIAGVAIHYLVMPLAAFLLARLFDMPPELTAGMILVGSVASGTGSTLMLHLGSAAVPVRSSLRGVCRSLHR